MAPDDPVDAEQPIRALLAQGDERGATAEVMRAYGPKVLAYLRSSLRDEADAGEAFSVWAEHLWGGIRSFQGESSFRTWAFEIAHQAALDVRAERERKRRG